MDFMDERAPDILREALGAQPDLILSDMAANTVGHAQPDHLRTMALVEAAAWFAIDNLKKGGAFVAKVIASGSDHDLPYVLKMRFPNIKHARSETRPRGTEYVSPCISRWSAFQ